jgi:hypothetical protein
VDRFLVWLGAGMVSAGVIAAMVAGAGCAAADTTPGSGLAGTTSSESTTSADTKANTDTDGATALKPKPKPKPKRKTSGAGSETTADETEPTAATAKDPTGLATAEKLAGHPTRPAAIERKPAAKPVDKQEVEQPKLDDAAELTQPSVESAAAVVPLSASSTTATTLKTAAPRATAIASTAAAPSPVSGLLSAVGTVVFNLYGLAIGAVGGPPVLPAGSTVTVRSSTLQIDCGNGYTVPADWYIPNSVEPPTRLIYLQHGFLAAGPWYSYTAAALAEQTNSIVVAPSITSNFLSCDACWLGAPPMQRAVADLFSADNTALADSALAAGYTGPIPDRVVLVGHSLGGGLVARTAG